MGNAITHLCPRVAQIYAALRLRYVCADHTYASTINYYTCVYSDVCQRYAGTVRPDDGSNAADLRKLATRFRRIASHLTFIQIRDEYFSEKAERLIRIEKIAFFCYLLILIALIFINLQYRRYELHAVYVFVDNIQDVILSYPPQ